MGFISRQVDQIQSELIRGSAKNRQQQAFDFIKQLLQPLAGELFDDVREAGGGPKADFQMLDLRAKAWTDNAESSGNSVQAKDQLDTPASP